MRTLVDPSQYISAIKVDITCFGWYDLTKIKSLCIESMSNCHFLFMNSCYGHCSTPCSFSSLSALISSLNLKETICRGR